MSTEIGAVETATVEATQNETQAPEQAVEAAKAAARMFKLKVNGKEEEVPEDVVVREAQISRAMRAKAQKMGMTVKEYDAFKAALDSDDHAEAALLERMGEERLHNLAVKHLSKKLQQEMLTPEQRRALALEQENAKLKSEFQKREQAAKDAESRQLQQFFAKQFDAEIPAAIKSAGLPETPAVVNRFVDLMRANIEDDVNLSPAEVARYLRQELRSETQQLLKGLKDEDLGELLDEGLMDRRRKLNIARAKDAQRSARAPVHRSAQEPVEKKELTTDDFRAYVERIRNGEG